jgi:hypothetical protein
MFNTFFRKQKKGSGMLKFKWIFLTILLYTVVPAAHIKLSESWEPMAKALTGTLLSIAIPGYLIFGYAHDKRKERS